MASDLIAITETLGLEVCIGISSGSVVAALDSLSPTLFDVLGNVASSAQLLADVSVQGQVGQWALDSARGREGQELTVPACACCHLQIILDEGSYQLICRDSFSYKSSQVITHHLKVRLLNGEWS